ncbi:MAG TPA: cupin domain-containing protein [Terriglobales bacterium]
MRLITFALFGALQIYAVPTIWAQSEQARPHPKVIKLDSLGKDYLSVLGGPPESVSMKSGLVVLAPKKSVGKHSTGQHEELVIILEGRGEMTFADGLRLAAEANRAIYCPPETEHNVTNTGKTVLRYVYVVATVKQP